MELGRRVMFPVRSAAGRVEELLLKYPPNGQPRLQRLRYWQTPRPSKVAFGSVMWAVRPMVTRRPSSNFSATDFFKSFSTQFRAIWGWNFPSGNCLSPKFSPLTPIYSSTLSYHGE